MIGLPAYLLLLTVSLQIDPPDSTGYARFASGAISVPPQDRPLFCALKSPSALYHCIAPYGDSTLEVWIVVRSEGNPLWK